MQDWNIKVKFVGEEQLPKPKLIGFSEWEADSRNAVVNILSIEDFKPREHLYPYDAEQVLVHELIHVKFHVVDKEGDAEYEFAIDSLADRLVALRRAIQSSDSFST